MEAKGHVAALLRGKVSAPEELIAEKVSELRSAGVRTVGVLAEPRPMEGQACGAGYLRDIATAAQQRIYLDEPPPETGCDLDSAGVAAACQKIVAQIPASDVVVLSKFGKLEADGGGLVPAFRAAIGTGKPVLTTVSDVHLDAWKSFAPDAVLLADASALESWCRSVGAGASAAGTT